MVSSVDNYHANIWRSFDTCARDSRGSFYIYPLLNRKNGWKNVYLRNICWYHDSAACLIENGKILSAVQEERFTRKNMIAVFLNTL